MHANIIRSHPLFVGAALSVILCSLVAAAAITGVIPSAISQKSAAQPAKAAPALPPCANCGTVRAIRQVQIDSPQNSTAWRITVRMDDESHRALSQAEPPALAVGDKVRVVNGRAVALK